MTLKVFTLDFNFGAVFSFFWDLEATAFLTGLRDLVVDLEDFEEDLAADLGTLFESLAFLSVSFSFYFFSESDFEDFDFLSAFSFSFFSASFFILRALIFLIISF